MKRETIFKKALDKASDEGWRTDPILTAPLNEGAKVSLAKRWIKNGDYMKIIFSPEFGKAFFGEMKSKAETGRLIPKRKDMGWEFQQHEMLDEIQEGKDPIKYLEKFI